MQEHEALKITQQWIEDWNRHDLDAILSHYAEEIDFTSPIIAKRLGSTNGNIRDKVTLKTYFQKGLESYPDLKFEPLQILVGVNSIVIYYRSIEERLAAEFMMINEQGLITVVHAHYTPAI